MAKIATKKKHKKLSKEEVSQEKREERDQKKRLSERPYLRTITTIEKEVTWSISELHHVSSYKDISDGLQNNKFFILITDVDAEHALVIDKQGNECKIVARLKHDGSGDSCNVEFKAGL